MRKITESAPLAPHVVGPHEPPANVTSDEEWLQCVHFSLRAAGRTLTWVALEYSYIKTFLGTIYHPMGTAAMLPRELGGKCRSGVGSSAHSISTAE